MQGVFLVFLFLSAKVVIGCVNGNSKPGEKAGERIEWEMNLRPNKKKQDIVPYRERGISHAIRENKPMMCAKLKSGGGSS